MSSHIKFDYYSSAECGGENKMLTICSLALLASDSLIRRRPFDTTSPNASNSSRCTRLDRNTSITSFMLESDVEEVDCRRRFDATSRSDDGVDGGRLGVDGGLLDVDGRLLEADGRLLVDTGEWRHARPSGCPWDSAALSGKRENAKVRMKLDTEHNWVNQKQNFRNETLGKVTKLGDNGSICLGAEQGNTPGASPPPPR